MDDAAIYVISFDWRMTKLSGSSVQSIFRSGPMNAAGTVRTYSKTLGVNRGTGMLNDKDSTDYFQTQAGEWHTVTIVVDNATGHSYVYIDGTLYKSEKTVWFKATTEFQNGGTLAWYFGEEWYTHEPEWDNFKVSIIKEASVATNVE